MSRPIPVKENLIGRSFGKLEVLGLSDKRGSRGARTVPLWECRCECGSICHKATDTLKNPDISMCSDCAERYSGQRMRERAGYVGGTQISRITSDKPNSSNTSGQKGVYPDKKTGKWRVRLRFKRKLYDFGTYADFDDAVKARKEAEEKIFGEFLDSLRP